MGTDGLLGKPDENGHPRAFGSFPRAIRYYVFEKGLFTLEDMVRRMTGMTAERLKLQNKGLIREGYDADIVLVNMEKFRDTATYERSNTTTVGVEAVFVNGNIAYRNGALTDGFFGRAARRK